MILYKILYLGLSLEAFDSESDTFPKRRDIVADSTIYR